MPIDWITPIVAVVKNRKDIAALASELWGKAFSKKFRLALTGMEGAGKTVLLHALTGEAFARNYKKPGRSQALEKGHLQSQTKKIVVSVVPGQPASPRYLALDEIFRGSSAIDGVIHVVSSGFASVRMPDSVRVLVNDHDVTTVRKFRQYQRRREVEDLRGTCTAIRDAHRRHHSPKWLLLAVDKVDLYHDELADLQRQYSPSAKTDFVRELNALAQRVGTDFFRWSALPVVGCIEDFEWNGHAHPSQLKADDRDRYLEQFLRELETYCVRRGLPDGYRGDKPPARRPAAGRRLP